MKGLWQTFTGSFTANATSMTLTLINKSDASATGFKNTYNENTMLCDSVVVSGPSQ